MAQGRYLVLLFSEEYVLGIGRLSQEQADTQWARENFGIVCDQKGHCEVLEQFFAGGELLGTLGERDGLDFLPVDEVGV